MGVLLAMLEDKTLSCPRRHSRRKPLSNTCLEDVTRRRSSHKSQMERTLCLPSEDVFLTKTLPTLPHMSSPLLKADGIKLFSNCFIATDTLFYSRDLSICSARLFGCAWINSFL